jgi:hypothetical protein
MEPTITAVITAALATGVAAGTAHVAEQGVRDAYNALKAALKARFGEQSEVAQAVDALEQKPGVQANEDALAAQLEQVQAARDAEFRQLARVLTDALSKTARGQQVIMNWRGKMITGDYTTIHGDVNM